MTRQKKIMYIGMAYDYGDMQRGYSFEYRNFQLPLESYCRKQDWAFATYDFVVRGNALGIDAMSEELYETVRKEEPDAIFAVLFDFGKDPHLSVFARIRALGIPLIHWFCDDHWRFEKYSSLVAPHFDYVCTTAGSALEKYAKAGLGNRVIKTQWACNHEMYKPYAVARDIPMSFVGQPHGDRIEVISRLQKAGVRVDVFGFGWKDRPRVPFHQMVRLFSRSRINLNLSNSSTLIGQQIKGRNFEVPGCGGFLLTSNADNLDAYFKPGEEIAVFASQEELIEKAKYYAAHPEEAERIARRGYERTIAEHTWHHRFAEIFSFVVAHPHRRPTEGKDEPKVSVIIPCYKQAHFLREAVISVVNQTYRNWECVIVNDGSPDETSDVARRLIAEHPSCDIRLLEKENGGLSSARNAGIAAATGDYILPLDSDDSIHPQMLEKTVPMLRARADISIVATDTQRFGQRNDTYPTGVFDAAKMRKTDLINYCSLYRKSLWVEAGGYNSNMRYGYEDWDFWVGCLERGHRWENVRELLFNYRIREGSMLAVADRHRADGLAQMIMNHPASYSDAEVRWASRKGDTHRVLIVVHNFPPRWHAGVEVYTADFVGALVKKGQIVSVLYPVYEVTATVPRLEIRQHDGYTAYELYHNLNALDRQVVRNELFEHFFLTLLRSECFDVVHFQHMMFWPFSFIEFAHKAGCAVCVTAHDFWLLCSRIYLRSKPGDRACTGPSSAEKCCECLLAGKDRKLIDEARPTLLSLVSQRQQYGKMILETYVETMTAPSEFIAGVFRANGFGGGYIAVASLGLSPFETVVRTESSQPLVFGFMGSISAVKNVQGMIRAFSQTRIDARLVIYGKADESLREAVLHEAAKDPRIVCRGAYLPQQRAEILSQFDMLVVPSLTESFSLVVREAFLAGVPVIASRAGALPEVVKDMENGLLFEPGDDDALARCFERIAAQPELLRSLRKNIPDVKTIDQDGGEWVRRYQAAVRIRREPDSRRADVLRRIEMYRAAGRVSMAEKMLRDEFGPLTEQDTEKADA